MLLLLFVLIYLQALYKSIADFDDFSMMIWNESISEQHYSVTVTFSLEAIVQSIIGLESNESCSINSTQFSKTAKISCANLKYNTSYTLIFHGLINFTDAVVPLQFIVNFVTKTLANEQVTGKRN